VNIDTLTEWVWIAVEYTIYLYILLLILPLVWRLHLSCVYNILYKQSLKKEIRVKEDREL